MSLNKIVSIITPSFNRANIVIDTAESIFTQTYPHWEWVIVDDGSTDNSLEVLEGFTKRDERVKVFRRDRLPKGACTCRNIAVDHCNGDYLIFLDTDDILEPFCIEQRIKTMQDQPSLDFAIFPSLMFHDQPYDLNLWWNIDKEESELVRQFHQDAICQGTGVIWKKDSFNRIGRWDENLFLWQDIDLFLRAFIQGYQYKKFFELPPDLHNRITQTSLSRGNFFDIKKQESRVVVVRRAVELLNKYKMVAMKREAKYMLSEIISGFIRTGYYSKADELMGWGLAEGVFNNTESSILRRYKNSYKFKLIRFSFIQKKMDQNLIPLTISNTLGKLPFKQGMKTNPI